MTPTETLVTEMLTMLGADTVTLAAANFLIPIKTPFTAGPNPILVDADIADFDGSTPLATGAATRPVYSDSATGDLFLSMPPPAGGFIWHTTGVTNLPQTIYGVALSTDSTTVEGADLMGTVAFDTGVVLNAVGQVVQQDEVRFTLILPALQ